MDLTRCRKEFCYPQPVSSLDRIRANRQEHAEATARLDTALPLLVAAAMDDEGATWQQVAEVLRVSKQRVYQLRSAGRAYKS